MQTYDDGFYVAKSDYAAGLSPRPLRGYSLLFRNGYSDGWFQASKADKKW